MFLKVMKKKSEVLPIYMEFITFLMKQYNMKVYILYTNFREFNSATAKAYFAYKGIK